MKITVEVKEIPAFYTGVVEYPNKDKEYYVQGSLHRLDGPAVEYNNGAKEYFVHGKRHRQDGPAVEFAGGTKEYWFEGKYHRLDGPAVELSDGIKYYFIHGKNYSEEEFLALTAKKTCDTSNKVVEIDGKKYKLTLAD